MLISDLNHDFRNNDSAKRLRTEALIEIYENMAERDRLAK